MRSVGNTAVRERWRMGPEARGLIFVSAVLTAFGLAVLYSSSAFVADHDFGNSAYLLIRQLGGVAAGMIAFAIAAKVDAERLRTWAWPIMWFAIVTMTAVLVLPEKIAPTLHGSRRFLFGGSFQPSEFAKLAVV
ncbi:MAG: FtsW/RodA/SpoVE family cell cycle protein, partial [bacterium]